MSPSGILLSLPVMLLDYILAIFLMPGIGSLKI